MTSISSLPSPKGRKSKANIPIPQPVLRHVPEVLRRAYLATEIAICVDGNSLPAAQAVGELPTPVFVLTVWNPFSKKLGRSENRLRNLELRAALLETTDRILPATAGIEGLPVERGEPCGLRDHPLGSQGVRSAVRTARSVRARTRQAARHWLLRRLEAVARSYDEEVEIAPNCGPTLAELLDDELGLDTEVRFEEALHRGWEMEGPLGVACPKCGGEELLLAGCDTAAPGRLPCRATALICRAEPR